MAGWTTNTETWVLPIPPAVALAVGRSPGRVADPQCGAGGRRAVSWRFPVCTPSCRHGEGDPAERSRPHPHDGLAGRHPLALLERIRDAVNSAEVSGDRGARPRWGALKPLPAGRSVFTRDIAGPRRIHRAVHVHAAVHACSKEESRCASRSRPLGPVRRCPVRRRHGGSASGGERRSGEPRRRRGAAHSGVHLYGPRPRERAAELERRAETI